MPIADPLDLQKLPKVAVCPVLQDTEFADRGDVEF